MSISSSTTAAQLRPPTSVIASLERVARRSASATSAATLRRRDVLSAGSNNRPVLPCVTRSTGPPTPGATTGTPLACASCTVWQKVITRTTDTTLGGLPTIGGAGLLDSEDEADFEYVERGDAKIVFTGQFVGEGANWNDQDTGVIYSSPPTEALIECVLEPDADGFFVTVKPDMISVEPGGGIVLIYEVIGENSNINIPPYNRRYILAARSDQINGIG